jgi:hypothetical protein
MKMTLGTLDSTFGQLQSLSSTPRGLKTTASSFTPLTSASGSIGVTLVTNALNDIVSNVTEYLRVAQVEKTKRAAISAKRDIALASIRAQRESLSELLCYTFAERSAVLQKQFETLDRAIACGDPGTVELSLKAMLTVVQSSPFETIQKMQQALGDKDFVIRLE